MPLLAANACHCGTSTADMRVNCANCGTAYLIDEKKIPPSGGKITCSRCGHINIVQPKTRATIPRLQRLSTMTKLSALRAQTEKDSGKEDIPPPLAEVEETIKNEPRRKLPEDITENLHAGRAADEEPADRPPETANIWKLKSNSGLIYDFSSLHDLRRWAKGRGNITQMRISRDGNNWKRYDEYSHLMRLTSPRLEIPGGASLTRGLGAGPASGSMSSFSDKSVSIAKKLAETRESDKSKSPVRKEDGGASSAVIPAAHILPAETGFVFNVPSFIIGLVCGVGILLILQVFGIINLAF